MINLLSIDLDIIFEPCIKLYDDRINHLPKQRLWDDMQDELEIYRHLSYDKNIYDNILNFFTNISKIAPNIKKIYVGENHSSIIYACKEITLKENGLISLINIDHHHDIFYDPKQEEDVFKYDVCTCANWVLYLRKHDVIASDYTWIRNHNSKEFFVDEGFINLHKYYINDFDFSAIGKDIDYLYITTSDKFCPPIFRKDIDNLINAISLPFENYHYLISHPDAAPIKIF